MDKKDLKEYVSNRALLIELEKEYSDLKADTLGVKSQLISDMPKTHTISKSVENAAIKLHEAQEKVILQRERTIEALVRVENIVSSDILDSREELLLRMKYIRNLSWVEVAAEMDLGWAQTHRIHSEILDKIKNL